MLRGGVGEAGVQGRKLRLTQREVLASKTT